VKTLQAVRRLAVELRPKALDDFGLLAALERLAEAFGGDSGIAIDVEANLDETRLPPEVETALYRIAQEALTNVAKHADADHVSLIVTRRDGAVTVVVEDNGRGFGAAGSDSAGLGLVGMKERVGLLGGRLAIESTEGSGTTIVAEVPLR
jgi:signal transduction histidine kinase